jgi:RNA recognition motif-containing protein
MQNRLYVGNLPFTATEEAVRDVFAEHGEVAKTTVVCDRETGRPRGFAFVEMASDADAAKAMRAVDGRDLGGRALRVNIAEPREAGGGGRSRDSRDFRR